MMLQTGPAVSGTTLHGASIHACGVASSVRKHALRNIWKGAHGSKRQALQHLQWFEKLSARQCGNRRLRRHSPPSSFAQCRFFKNLSVRVSEVFNVSALVPQFSRCTRRLYFLDTNVLGLDHYLLYEIQASEGRS